MTPMLQGMSTPSERLFHHQHQERLKRIADAAARLKPVVVAPPEPAPADLIKAKRADDLTVIRLSDIVQDLGNLAPPTYFHVSARRFEHLQMFVGAAMKVNLATMLGPHRDRHTARARQIAMYLARQYFDASYPEIGRNFGGRDHTTVVHAFRIIRQIMQSEPGTDITPQILAGHADQIRIIVARLSAEIEAWT